jgi:hypothetical protein
MSAVCPATTFGCGKQKKCMLKLSGATSSKAVAWKTEERIRWITLR